MRWPDFTTNSPSEQYSFSSRPGDNRPIRVLICIGLLFMAAFLWVYFQPQNRGVSWLFILLTISVLFKLLRLLHEWYHYWRVKPTTTPETTRTWTVDVLTTYCDGEPKEMVVNTLRAIQRITYPHTTYLCDEANDPYLQQVCAELGVIHVTRQVKIDAKAGNINNALRQATGEICLIIDPDHIPVPDFLSRVLPHFDNPVVGFVQCVQGYYNHKESLAAFGASEQTYSFYGPMMTCMGNYGTAQAIGANCTFRRSALDSIGGHANGLSEDMHTAMWLHAGGWQSVYVPLPLSYGLVPATLSAYYKQQLKWARGTFELLFTTYPKVFNGLTGSQRLHYATLPLYYLLGVVQLIDLLIPILSLMTMKLPLQLDLLLFGTVYIPLLLTGFLVRQYAQRWLIERHEVGFHLAGGILASGTWWVYVLGFVYTVFRVRVPYIPTPKDDQPRNHILLVLPNVLMSGLTLLVIGYSIYWYGRFALNNIYFQLMIGFGLLNTLILMLNVLVGQEKMLMGIRNWLSNLSASRAQVRNVRIRIWNLRYGLYNWLRQAAVPLFVGVLILTIGMGVFTYRKASNTVPNNLRYANTQPFYVGMASYKHRPAAGTPVSSRPIIPYHLNWSIEPQSIVSLPPKLDVLNQLPLLYIEPAGIQAGSEVAIRTFLLSIIRGERDAALHRFVLETRSYNRFVFASFMPEFDNAARPWGVEQTANLILCRQAWQHIVHYCHDQKATNITWVWCPFLPSTLVTHYPGNGFVDWLGFNVTNDPNQAPDRKSHSFAALFQLSHTAVRTHPAYSIRQKPILITHLTSVAEQPDTTQWTIEAIDLLQERYPTVRGVIFRDENEWRTYRATLVSARPN
ncbi:glycosyltransferase family 2 protein [Spirosoma luteum]|uniref:glycosyltransferase family 2 protein n=1 Tax=Spirosoma luteum TaxID=431553 RepID=UPI0003805CBD|nr:cellulose synthase catalytic subunit [Spirosoma luteum]